MKIVLLLLILGLPNPVLLQARELKLNGTIGSVKFSLTSGDDRIKSFSNVEIWSSGEVETLTPLARARVLAPYFAAVTGKFKDALERISQNNLIGDSPVIHLSIDGGTEIGDVWEVDFNILTDNNMLRHQKIILAMDSLVVFDGETIIFSEIYETLLKEIDKALKVVSTVVSMQNRRNRIESVDEATLNEQIANDDFYNRIVYPPKEIEFVKLNDYVDIGKYEVTQYQWYKVTGENPSYFKEKEHCPEPGEHRVMPDGVKMCSNHPVESIFRGNNILEFIHTLNQRSGLVNCRGDNYDPSGCYRLPTEEEWEQASRRDSGGNLDQYAWWSGNSIGQTHEVGTKAPNDLGLYDTWGNVCELVSDIASTWILKGGAYSTREQSRLDSSDVYVNLGPRGTYYTNIGFRLVRYR